VLENLFALLFITYENIEAIVASKGAKEVGSAKRGFICGPHLLRDVVNIIKDCTGELEREPKTEIDQSGVTCSILPTQFENRLDRSFFFFAEKFY